MFKTFDNTDLPAIPLQNKRFHNEIPFTTSFGRTNYKAYVDTDARERYQASKSKLSELVLNMQKLGECLPILEAKIHTGIRTRILDIRIPKIPTLSPFNRFEDWQDYCTVNKFSHVEYKRFEIAFGNHSIFMFQSNKYPITDFTVAGVRYRWIRHFDQGFLSADRYCNYLFELDAKQPSLADNLVNNDVNPSNLLLPGRGSTFLRKAFLPQYQSSGKDFISSKKIAQLIDKETVMPFKKQQKSATLFIGLDQELKGVQHIDEKLMIILISITVLMFEDDRDESKRDKRDQRRNNNYTNNNFF